MRHLLLVVLAGFALATSAFAGPNREGTLVVHATGVAYTYEMGSHFSVAPTCAEVANQLPVGPPPDG